MYATLADVQNLGLPAQAIAQMTPAQTTAILQAASDEADGYFTPRYGIGSCPLLQWDTSITNAVAKIAAFRMMRVRGYQSNSGADKSFEADYNDAKEFLKAVQHQQITPNVKPASLNLPGSVQPQVVSVSVVDLSTGATRSNRGW